MARNCPRCRQTSQTGRNQVLSPEPQVRRKDPPALPGRDSQPVTRGLRHHQPSLLERDREEMLKLISWNINGRVRPWDELLDSDSDVALLQEARRPRGSVAELVETGPQPWMTSWESRPWRTAVVRLSDRVDVEWLESKPIEGAANGRFVHSLSGTIAAAVITPAEGDPILAISMYAPRERTYRNKRWMYADASAHRLIFRHPSFPWRRQPPPDSGGRGPEHPVRLRGGREESFAPLPVRIRPDGSHRAVVRGTPASQRPAGRPLARRTTERQPERPHLPSQQTETGDRHPANSTSCLRRRNWSMTWRYGPSTSLMNGDPATIAGSKSRWKETPEPTDAPDFQPFKR